MSSKLKRGKLIMNQLTLSIMRSVANCREGISKEKNMLSNYDEQIFIQRTNTWGGDIVEISINMNNLAAVISEKKYLYK